MFACTPVVPGIPHHVTQRGNRRTDVFFDDADRVAYRNLVRHYFRFHQLDVWAFCLMTNHVHFVVVPPNEDALALAFHDAHTAYSLSLNRRYKFSGHLWQGRFYSCPLDEQHLWAAVRYVERNPVRAGMVCKAEAYPWSSAASHCAYNNDPLLSPAFPPAGTVENWSEWLSLEDPAQVQLIRSRTHTGRPCGSKAFIDTLEQLLSRVLHVQKPGPKKLISDSETESLFGVE